MYKLIVLSLFLFFFTFICKAVNFNSPRSVTLPTYQIASASGDLNNDGFPDLITGGYSRQDSQRLGRIYVMLGKGNGSFQPPLEYGVGYNSNEFDWSRIVREIKIADLDNDRKLDVAVIHNDSLSYNQSTVYVTVLFGNGDGTLQTAEGYSFPSNSEYNYVSSFTLADMDKDGLTDIVFSEVNRGTSATIHVLRNIGSRNFNLVARIVAPFNINGIAAVDLNDDQYLDYILATSDGIIIGYSDNRFVPIKTEQRDAGVLENGLLIDDFNADGKVDFAVIPILYPQIKVFINNQDSFPEIPSVYALNSTASTIQSTDVNGDGRTDLLTNNNIGSTYQIHYNTENGTFNNSEIIQDVFVEQFAPVDFNLDGKIDLGISGGNPKVLLNSPNNTRYYTDFSGDRKSDFTVYRPSTGTWWTLFNGANNSTVYRAIQFGISTDKIVPGNYDNDNKADIAVFRDGVWYILQSSDNAVRIEQWGLGGDIPVPSDFDNDGATNLAVFRPSSGTWYIKTGESYYAVNWGIETDKAVPADYDGDGKTDIAVYRPSNGTWYILNSKNGQATIKNFGLAEDKTVAADYDGDGKSDIAVFRPSNGVWYIEQTSNNSVRYQQFGLPEDTPVTNDFDGDGKNDISVFRKNNGSWHILNSFDSSNSSINWGSNYDIPIQLINNF